MSAATVFVPADVGVIVQGISGRTGRQHARLMREYGTRILAGVSLSNDLSEIDGVPVFANCAQAVRATAARASVIMVPPLATLPAIREAVDAGIEWIVTIAEGMPIADAVHARALTRAAGVRWIGPSTPGLAIPGRLKLGFMPSVSLARGPLGVMAKSGTLSYEICYRLVRRGLGQTLWVGVGGDPVKGTRFVDLLPWFLADDETRAIVLIGEIGGSDEEEFADAMTELRCSKPVFALVAGRSAREGMTMGHAGAIVFGDTGGLDSKSRALAAAGARVHLRIRDLVDDVASATAQ